jgi:hypothetical protein
LRIAFLFRRTRQPQHDRRFQHNTRPGSLERRNGGDKDGYNPITSKPVTMALRLEVTEVTWQMAWPAGIQAWQVNH